MRNRFKEMVDAGVAQFNYSENAPETPVLDPFVRTYNIYWGQPTDTHMTIVDGKYLITGSLFEKENKFYKNGFLWRDWIRGIDIASSGYNSLSDFFYKNNKDYKEITYNGSLALEVFDRPEAGCGSELGYDVPCACYTCMTCDSQIPESYAPLEYKRGIIRDMREKCETVREFVEKINESKMCRGTFAVLGGKVVCIDGEKTYTIE